jgi:hypothetical protein
MSDAPLRVGDELGTDDDAYVGGCFGRNYDGPFRVEAIGADWVVARSARGVSYCYHGDPELLVEYRP